MSADDDQKGGGKVRLRSLDDLDKRTRAAQDVFALRDQMREDLGGVDRLSIMQLEIIDHASCLGAMLRDTAAGYLTGEPVDLSEYMTMTNAQRRLLADLGLQKRAKDIDGASWLQDLRKGHAA